MKEWYSLCFHSTDFPSEWGHAEVFAYEVKITRLDESFHSTDFPSEWGQAIDAEIIA